VRPAGLALIAALALASAACYESAQPLSRPGDRIEPALLGAWDCHPTEARREEPPILFRIIRFDDWQYYVETVEDSTLVNRYQAYPSRVGERTLLNVRDLAQKTAGDRWIFLRYALEGRDRMSFWVIAEESMKGVEPGQALATIRRRAADDALYQPMADCRRRP
jgi:hypothetical protein